MRHSTCSNHVLLHSPTLFTVFYLTRLSIDGNLFTSIEAGVFDKGWTSLKYLGLSNNANLATIEDGALPSETISNYVLLIDSPNKCHPSFVFAVVYGTPTNAYNKVGISLNDNPALTKLNENAFKPVLDYFEGKNYGFIGLKISLTGGNIQ